MKAINIKCEYLKNPIGIDIESPRIMWNCEGGIKQTAYQVVADGWDSGKVESSSMRCHLPIKLEAGKRVTYKIKLWDENGDEGELSEEAFFEYGIKNWKAKWITVEEFLEIYSESIQDKMSELGYYVQDGLICID